MTGSEYVYVPVEANAVMPMDEGGSGGAEGSSGMTYVNWTEDGGIIGKGWDEAIGMKNTPFIPPYNSEEAILEHLKSAGNLNTIFSNWRNMYDSMEQNEFLIAARDGVYGHTDNGGCIGERIY